MDEREALQRIIDTSDNIVFFGGAGVSTESGVPDFRSTDGLYHTEYKYPPEIILSRTFFDERPAEFFDFYRKKMLYPAARPNRAHLALAKWEERGKLKAVITQNIDGLHQMAGSKNVLELHGSVHRNFCAECGKGFSMQEILASKGVPHCPCGGIIQPRVVLYEDSLDDDVLVRAIRYLEKADALIVGGTSLAVYPAAGLIRHYAGNKLVLINLTPTPYDKRANLAIHRGLGDTLGEIHL